MKKGRTYYCKPHGLFVDRDQSSEGYITITQNNKIINQWLVKEYKADKKLKIEIDRVVDLIREDPRQYLIEQGITKIEENSKVMFCNEETFEHTLKNSLYIIKKVFRDSENIAQSVELENVCNPQVLILNVKASSIEPVN